MLRLHDAACWARRHYHSELYRLSGWVERPRDRSVRARELVGLGVEVPGVQVGLGFGRRRFVPL